MAADLDALKRSDAERFATNDPAYGERDVDEHRLRFPEHSEGNR
jgi:hypothetical protein